MIMTVCMETITPQAWTWNPSPAAMAGADKDTIAWA